MGVEIDETVKDRRITKPQHVNQVLSEQINFLRKLIPKDNREATMISTAITNAANSSRASINDWQTQERIKQLEEVYKKMQSADDLPKIK